MHSAEQQMMLHWPIQTTYARADFVASSSNEAARQWLEHSADWPNGRLVIWGAAGCGKTHLAHLWAEPSEVVSGAALHVWPGSSLEERIVIDQVDRCPNEAVLLHLLNSYAQASSAVLMTARSPPVCWGTELPDLSSRLRATTTVAIDPPDGDLLAALLVRLLAERQLVVTAGVQNWLLLRLPRTPYAIRDAVLRLDRASLAYGRPITRALARATLPEVSYSSTDPIG